MIIEQGFGFPKEAVKEQNLIFQVLIGPFNVCHIAAGWWRFRTETPECLGSVANALWQMPRGCCLAVPHLHIRLDRAHFDSPQIARGSPTWAGYSEHQEAAEEGMRARRHPEPSLKSCPNALSKLQTMRRAPFLPAEDLRRPPTCMGTALGLQFGLPAGLGACGCSLRQAFVLVGALRGIIPPSRRSQKHLNVPQMGFKSTFYFASVAALASVSCSPSLSPSLGALTKLNALARRIEGVHERSLDEDLCLLNAFEWF